MFSGQCTGDGLTETIPQATLFLTLYLVNSEEITSLLTITQLPRNVVLFAGAVLHQTQGTRTVPGVIGITT